jgi:Methyltransferase domain
MGFCRQEDVTLYDEVYWAEYRRRDDSEMGQRLTEARLHFVRRYADGSDMVDVGIGGGRFCSSAQCLGYDVNAHAIAWLKLEDKWFDLRRGEISTATFWDSLEHILDPRDLLRHVRHCAFVSTPIYRDLEDCLRSKHFKPGEHAYYWTSRGLVLFMGWHGFELLGHDDFETRAGREAIGSFAFRRRA